MDDSSLWVALAGLVAALATGAYTYRAKRSETQVAREAGYISGYDRLVEDLQQEIARLGAVVADLRAENTGLYREIRALRNEMQQLGNHLGTGGAS